MAGDVFKRSEDDESVITGFAPRRDKEKVFTVPDGVKVIGKHAFGRCRATAFVLPDGLEEIGESAFIYSYALRMVFIPASVKKVGELAFAFCPLLTVYCEDEPGEGWYETEPTYREEEITTSDDYAYDFHRGGVSTTTVTVKIFNSWNTSERPVVTHCSREEFMKILSQQGL